MRLDSGKDINLYSEFKAHALTSFHKIIKDKKRLHITTPQIIKFS